MPFANFPRRGYSAFGRAAAHAALALLIALVAVWPAWAAGAVPAFPVTVQDATGRAVTVDAAPQRIVSLAPSVTENLYALGLGDRIVGVSAWSNYPEAAKSKPVVGDAFNLNVEAIVALRPDLIVGDLQVVKNYVQKLGELGLPVFAINPTDVSGVMEALRILGRITGKQAESQAVVQEMQRRIDAVRRVVGNVPEERRPKVFIEYWHEPLMTAGPGSFPDEVIRLAGGRNIAHDAPSPWPSWSTELLIARNPDVILLTNGNKAEVLQRAPWKGLTAVQKGRLYEVNPDIFSRTTPRLAEAVEVLAKILYPDRF